MDDFLFPEALGVLGEAASRHAAAWAFLIEAVELAHLAHDRQQVYAAKFVPGTPGVRRVRNDINDDCLRYARLVCDPLIEAGLITAFEFAENGEHIVFPDGLHSRIKKADKSGNTSNARTRRTSQMAKAAQLTMYSEATALDQAIQEGTWIDLVYVAGEVHGQFEHLGLRFANLADSPLHVVHPAQAEDLRSLSPRAFDAVRESRRNLRA